MTVAAPAGGSWTVTVQCVSIWPMETVLDRVGPTLDGWWNCAREVGRQAQCALNGLIGHELETLGSSLAVPFVIEPFEPIDDDHPATPHLVVCVHGLMSSELVWRLPQRARSLHAGSDAGTDDDTVGELHEEPRRHRRINYGTELADALGGTALFARYNTGRRIGENGTELSGQLELLVESWPVPVESITLVGHSMGGLVIRSATWHAVQEGRSWPALAKRIFLIGSPHGGAPLEQAAHLGATGLSMVPLAPVQAVGQVIDRRSHGIKDLRHGRILTPEQADSLDPVDRHAPVPLLEGCDHFVIAGHLGSHKRHPLAFVLGDWLVPVASARRVPVPKEHLRVYPGVGHMALLHDWRIADQLVAWATESTTGARRLA